jgi:phenylalanyl-tRNA synthetase alpha chain
MNNINITSDEEKSLRQSLESRQDPDGLRMKRFLDMPDLSRTSGSPLAELVARFKAIPMFKDFTDIQVPEIVPADKSFDLFNFPADHPARSTSDTYYIDKNAILRTHTTIMWYYLFTHPEVQAAYTAGKPIGALSYGKVYRKDEIDRNHMNVFHQIDGVYIVEKSQKVITLEDLKEVLVAIAQAAFGPDVEYRFNQDTFPYTDPSLEMEIKRGDAWLEVLGCGVVRMSVLANFGIDPEKYTGWAFGFGLERLAMISTTLPDIRLLWSEDPRVKKQLVLGQPFQEVSKYPPITRDISFVVKKGFVPNEYFDLIRDIVGDMAEEVKLLDHFENEAKFGADRESYTYRVVYRSTERTLVKEEIDALQAKLIEETVARFGGEIR